jgi:hypothetical protein
MHTLNLNTGAEGADLVFAQAELAVFGALTDELKSALSTLLANRATATVTLDAGRASALIELFRALVQRAKDANPGAVIGWPLGGLPFDLEGNLPGAFFAPYAPVGPAQGTPSCGNAPGAGSSPGRDEAERQEVLGAVQAAIETHAAFQSDPRCTLTPRKLALLGVAVGGSRAMGG